MAARLSALRAGLTLPPGFFIFKDSWYSLMYTTYFDNIYSNVPFLLPSKEKQSG
jgi:hypothetical protein